MPSTRNERVEKLLFEPVTGDPTEAGQMHVTPANELKIYINSVVRSILAHATEHSAGGLQAVTAQNLSSGAATAGQVMQANGAGLWNLVSVVTGVAAELNKVSDAVLGTTVGTTPVQKLLLTTTSLPVGDYILFWSYTTVGSNNNTQVSSRVRKDGATDLFTITSKASVAGSEFGNAGHNVQVALSGVHTFAVDYWRAAGSGSAGIKDVLLTLWLIDN